MVILLEIFNSLEPFGYSIGYAVPFKVIGEEKAQENNNSTMGYVL